MADDVRLAQHLAGVLAGSGGDERQQQQGQGVGEVEVARIAVGEEVGDADDGGRGHDDDQRHARDRGKGTGVDGVDAQLKQCLLRGRDHPEVPEEQEWRGYERGHEPLDAPLDEAGLKLGLLVAVDAAGGDERPYAGQRAADAGAQEEARPVRGIEEGVPELAGLVAGAGDGEPCAAGGEHEGENAVDDDQREG